MPLIPFDKQIYYNEPKDYIEALYYVAFQEVESLRFQEEEDFLSKIIELITVIKILEEKCCPSHIEKSQWILMDRKKKWVSIINDYKHKNLDDFISNLKKFSDDTVLLSELIEKMYNISQNLLITYFTYKDVPQELFKEKELRELGYYFIGVDTKFDEKE